MSDNSRLKVAVIGGGIAGAELIRRALPGPYDITLIEPKNQIECQALYPEYIACNASLEDLVAPLKPFCDRVGAELINERAVRLEGNRVICDKSTVEYDLAVIATGAVQNYFGIHGSDKAFSVNTFSGAMRARDYLERKSPEKIVIIGSGLTGVETACALSDSLNANISVVETKNRLLPQFSENVSSIIEKTLFGKGVKTFVSMRVQEICEDSILFSDGQSLECDMAIWTGGIKPCEFVQGIELPKWKDEWILTDGRLRASDDVFVIGDSAWISIDGKVASKTAAEAEHQAKHMARNLKRLAEGREPLRYPILASTDASAQVALISIGREHAVGVYGGMCITMSTRLMYALKYWIDKSFINRFK